MKNLLTALIRLIAIWAFATTLSHFHLVAQFPQSNGQILELLQILGLSIGIGLIIPLCLWFSPPYLASATNPAGGDEEVPSMNVSAGSICQSPRIYHSDGCWRAIGSASRMDC